MTIWLAAERSVSTSAGLATYPPEGATTIRARSGNTSDRVYVHAKVAIVDDRWLTLGSANLNAHSFLDDSEVNGSPAGRAGADLPPL